MMAEDTKTINKVLHDTPLSHIPYPQGVAEASRPYRAFKEENHSKSGLGRKRKHESTLAIRVCWQEHHLWSQILHAVNVVGHPWSPTDILKQLQSTNATAFSSLTTQLSDDGLIVPEQSQSGQMLSSNELKEGVKLVQSHEIVFSALNWKLLQPFLINYESFEPVVLDSIPFIAVALLLVNFTTPYLQYSKLLYKMALCFGHWTLGSRNFCVTGLTGLSRDAHKRHRNFLPMLMS